MAAQQKDKHKLGWLFDGIVAASAGCFLKCCVIPLGEKCRR
jgi:hypothetical protein